MAPKQGEKTVQDLILERLDKLEIKVGALERLRWIIYGIGIILALQFGGVNLQKLITLVTGQ